LNRKNIYDITLPLYPGMAVFPGDPSFQRVQTYSLGHGDSFNLSKIDMGSHCGTHLDAPGHYISGGMTVDELPLELLIGEAKVMKVEAEHSIDIEAIQGKDIQEGDRILFKTKNSSLYQEMGFLQDYLYLSPDAARYLKYKKVRLVGIDYYSIDRFSDEEGPCHQILLASGIVILEGLNLYNVEEGRYHLIALPLKITGCDGSPVRAVLLQR